MFVLTLRSFVLVIGRFWAVQRAKKMSLIKREGCVILMISILILGLNIWEGCVNFDIKQDQVNWKTS